MKKEKIKIFKVIVFIVFIAIMIFLTIKLLPIFKNISTPDGREHFKENIQTLGFRGGLSIIGLMLIQIFLPILPRRTSRSISTECVLDQ